MFGVPNADVFDGPQPCNANIVPISPQQADSISRTQFACLLLFIQSAHVRPQLLRLTLSLLTVPPPIIVQLPLMPTGASLKR